MAHMSIFIPEAFKGKRWLRTIIFLVREAGAASMVVMDPFQDRAGAWKWEPYGFGLCVYRCPEMGAVCCRDHFNSDLCFYVYRGCKGRK